MEVKFVHLSQIRTLIVTWYFIVFEAFQAPSFIKQIFTVYIQVSELKPIAATI